MGTPRENSGNNNGCDAMEAGRGFEELASERDLGIVEILKAIRTTRRAVSTPACRAC